MFNGIAEAPGPEDIIRRLGRLKNWQEQQQKLLLENQNKQRIRLNRKQQEVYSQFGFSKNLDKNGDRSQSKSIKSNEDNENNTSEKFRIKIDDSNSKLNEREIDSTNLEKNHNLGTVVKRPFLKRGQGIISRFKINPDKFKLHNLPKYKYANTYKNLSKKSTINKKYLKGSSKNDNSADLSEKQSDQIDVNNDVKWNERNDSFLYASQNLKIFESSIGNGNQIFTQISEGFKLNITPRKEISNSNISLDKLNNSNPISWAQILDPTKIQPVCVSRLHSKVDDSSEGVNANDTENLHLFELLEKKAEEGSICFDTSSFKRWIETKVKLSESSAAIVPEAIKNSKIYPVPCDIHEKSLLASDEELSDSDKENRVEKGHVRFCDEVEVNEVEESDVETIESSGMDEVELTMTSTPIDKERFEKFKVQLLSNSNGSADDEITLTTEDSRIEYEDAKKDIVEKSEVLKIKLKELEQEINTFQKHNTELIKLKQEHELEKVKLQQERNELEEKLNDERIKLEIYLHDERLKIEEERKKLEKQIRVNKVPNRKEREEIVKLKEQVETLQKELKSKESNHVSAQARLRAQIRNLEKDLKDLVYESEKLKKENKKLENENNHLSRLERNSMLKEINKSIAKLAAPTKKNVIITETNNKNSKPEVSKVISHTNKKIHSRYQSKSVPDLQNINKVSRESDSDIESDIESSNSSNDINEMSNINSKNCTRAIPNFGFSIATELQSSVEKSNCSTLKTSRNNENLSSTNQFKREIINSDGSKDIWYPNGNLKKISSDGMLIRMLYYNKDIKETNISEGTVKYYYSETNTWHTTYLDGLEILEFPNGQTEHRYKNGVIEIYFKNGSVCIKNPNDDLKNEEWRYSDGTTLVQMKNGNKILSLSNGQKEIHTQAHKRREYPDGTVKLVYPDGSQETRYSNGRVRLKDKDGNLVMDSDNIK